MRRLPDILLIFTVILLIVAGQILAKYGAVSEKGGLLGLKGLNILLAGSYASFLMRGALWAWVLRRNPVSRVYPYLALAYPAVFAAGMILFGDPISPGRAIGTILIIGGSLLLASGGADEWA